MTIENVEIEITKEKLRQVLWLFEFTLPFDQVKVKNFQNHFKGIEFQSFMKSIIVTIKENYTHHPDTMAGYIRFIKEMCEYVLEDTKELPDVETEDKQKIIEYYYIQTNQYNKDHIVELILKDDRIQCL